EGVEELQEHLRVRVRGDVLLRTDLGGAVGEQVYGDAPADARESLQLVAPEGTVQQNAVHEERHGAASLLDVGDSSRRGLDEAPLCLEFLDLHGRWLPFLGMALAHAPRGVVLNAPRARCVPATTPGGIPARRRPPPARRLPSSSLAR